MRVEQVKEIIIIYINGLSCCHVVMECPQSHVSHCVVDTSNGEGSEGGCSINMDPHGQSTSETTSNRRMGGTEFVGPADGWCVVAPCCHVDMS